MYTHVRYVINGQCIACLFLQTNVTYCTQPSRKNVSSWLKSASDNQSCWSSCSGWSKRCSVYWPKTFWVLMLPMYLWFSWFLYHFVWVKFKWLWAPFSLASPVGKNIAWWEISKRKLEQYTKFCDVLEKDKCGLHFLLRVSRSLAIKKNGITKSKEHFRCIRTPKLCNVINICQLRQPYLNLVLNDLLISKKVLRLSFINANVCAYPPTVSLFSNCIFNVSVETNFNVFNSALCISTQNGSTWSNVLCGNKGLVLSFQDWQTSTQVVWE